MIDYHYIRSNSELARYCQEWASASFLAVDTEFIRTDTFFPIAGLIQIGVAGKLFLIDPLTIDEWSGLVALFEDVSIPKVLHSCSEDLEVFQRLLGCIPTPILDTQIGAGLAGYGSGISYQRLVEACLGEHVEKGETRSDWLQRPLTERQCSYAALDVEYLQSVYVSLVEALKEVGRLQWWHDECQQMLDNVRNAPSTAQYYQRIKTAWKLRGKNLLLLQRLCEWREGEAQQQNIPRGRILKDNSCFEIARQQPANSIQLNAIKDVSSKIVRHHGELILNMVSEALAEDDRSVLPANLAPPLGGDDMRKFKSLRSVVQDCAEQANLPAELLMKKRDIEYIVREAAWPDSLPDWRMSLVGEGLSRYLKKESEQ